LKLLFVIDHLGLGGAQRQMTELACGLKRLGHTVEFLVYFPEYDFFTDRVEAAGIPVHRYRKGRGFSFAVIWKLVALMRNRDFDLVLAFLNSPIIYAELARFIARKPILVVSERCSHHDDRSAFAATGRRALHQAADVVVSNSETHAAWLRAKWWLSGKVAAIYNGFEVDSFGPAAPRPARPADIRLLAIGRICPQKNLLNLIEGLSLFEERYGYAPGVSWVGRRDADSDPQAQSQDFGGLVLSALDKHPRIKKKWHWLGEQGDMGPIFREHHALVHPSFYEGLPNAVCEALAAGMPVVVSDVCDHSLLVAEGKRGFLFDPANPESIAAALHKLLELSPGGWTDLSADARKFAADHLGLDRMVRAYETLFLGLVDR
jgi:glycosyltransferase involved in cell wall biosynthesis